MTTPTLPFDRPDPLTPPPEYARLRASAPVAPVLTPDGRRAWLVTSYETVAAVLSDRRFGLAPPGTDMSGNDTLFQDGEAHARLRRLVSKAFSPRSIAALRPHVERLAGDYVSTLADHGPPADLVTDLAAPLSIRVIGELLGVPTGDRARLRGLADAASATDFLFADEEDLATAAQAWNELGAYAGELVAAKRETPSDAELIAMTTTIVSAGYLSASNAISTGAIRLLAEGRLPALATSTTEQTDTAVQEVLRLQAGRTGEPFPRYAQDDLQLGGVPIAAGDLVLVRLEAAHRDPEHFADPDRFWPERRAGTPLVFGHGMHYCLGAPLAHIEITAALRALARRLPGLRLQGPVEDIEWTTNAVDIGPKAVHTTW
ncbi:cytochrome P450 [Nonomuraea sp. K274]|uniref:Cytochrome P450 n=1 Tax=Nonomuraea cypriaca TaxID=1187855 RepID=A0A931AEX1_9ACTN|nr:cytochrome P450 [Nonomuraea cypriaca]MBF8187982.1 cytochrome P450 [Nonomuraea cypriaca]